MSDAPIMHDLYLGEQILDLLEEIATDMSPAIKIHFEELTAEAGPLPRLMLSPVSANGETESYISGERVCPFPCAVTLRVKANDEQDRIDTGKYLSTLAKEFLGRSIVLPDYVAYRKPSASMATCLGRTSAFEDWQVTLDLKYKQIKK